MAKKDGLGEVKFHFFNDSYRVRKYDLINGGRGLLYIPFDHKNADHEISYHSSNKRENKPVILPKSKEPSKRTPISREVIDLDLINLIVPIPICRIATNRPLTKNYTSKEEHLTIHTDAKYNTVDIYIADKKYDHAQAIKKFPLIAGRLFPITTIDYLIYGAGFGVEPIFKKMFETGKQISTLNSSVVGEYQFFYRTYELLKTDRFIHYSKEEYQSSNFIEFFNNIEYLNLLATTDISFKIDEEKNTPPKPAYKYDIEHMKRIGLRNNTIRKFNKRFSKKYKYYQSLNVLRSGIIFSG